MSGETLLALAERCEKASGPDRELDTDIFLAVRPSARGRIFNAPKYTASLDAAMTLVPEGWQCDGLKWWTDDGASCALVGSTWGGDEWVHRFDDGKVSSSAFTPALAICAAALRARAHQATSNDG